MTLTVFEALIRMGRDEKFNIVKIGAEQKLTRVPVSINDIEYFNDEVPARAIDALELEAVRIDLERRVIYAR